MITPECTCRTSSILILHCEQLIIAYPEAFNLVD